MTVAIGPGALFGGYRIEAVVGRGGMGVVYRAIDLSLERPVALKLIAPEFAQNPGFRERFLREPRLAASLDHPGLVPIYEAGEHDEQLYLAMRWVEGSDLRRMLQRDGRLSPNLTVSVLTQVAAALDATHRGGVVHRDVKPANILVDDDGHAYLGDFGISGEAGAEGRMTGTLDYLAPEQIRGEDIDGRTDCFALGCVLHECLSGAPPFRRETENEALWAHLREPPPPLRDYPQLDAVIARALAKERAERYPRCEEMVRAAAAALGVAGPARTGRRLSGPTLLVLGGSVLLAVASAAALVSGLGGDEQAPRVAALGVATNSVAAVGMRAAGVELAVPLPGRPTDVALSGGTAWVSTVDSTSVTGVSGRTSSITRTVPLPGRADAVATGAGSVWVADAGRGVVSRIPQGYEHVTQRFRFRPSPRARPGASRLRGSRATLAAGAGTVWLANGTRDVMRIDASSGQVSQIAAPVRIDAVAAGGGEVWAVGSRAATVFRIDVKAGTLGTRAPLTGRSGSARQFPVGIAATGFGVWVLDGNAGTVTRLDPATLAVAATTHLAIDRVPSDIAASGRTAWVSNGDGSLSRIEPGQATAKSVRVGESLERVAAGAGRVWVTATAFDQRLPGGAG
jgi:Protein kinase domain